MEVALLSLGDHLPDPVSGRWTSNVEKFRLVVDQAVAAEAVGFDAVMLGEHHYCGYIISSRNSCSPPSPSAHIASA